MATPPILSSLIGINTEGVAYKVLNQHISIKHALNGQNQQYKGVDRLAEQQMPKLILMICAHRFWSLSALGGYFLSFGGMLAVRCLE